MITRKQVKRYVGQWVILRTNKGIIRGQLVSFDGKHLKLRVPRKPRNLSIHTSANLCVEQRDMLHSFGPHTQVMTTAGYPYPYDGYPYPCYSCYPCVVPFVAVTGIALFAAGAFFF